MDEEGLALYVLSYYNGNWFTLNQIVECVKLIDRKFSARRVRAAVKSAAASEEIESTTTNRGLKLYRIWDTKKPYRLPGARLPVRDTNYPGEDLVPMDGWPEGPHYGATRETGSTLEGLGYQVPGRGALSRGGRS